MKVHYKGKFSIRFGNCYAYQKSDNKCFEDFRFFCVENSYFVCFKINTYTNIITFQNKNGSILLQFICGFLENNTKRNKC